MFARVFVATVLGTVAWTGFCDSASVKAWRPKERWKGVNLPYCLYHKEVRKDATYNEEDFRFVHELGLNFVRLPLDYRCWIKDGDWNQIDEAALAPLDEALEWGKRYGLHVQFCFHRAPGFSVNRWPAETRDLFKEKEVQEVCRKHWAYFARRWRHVPNERLSFNLFNESPDAPNLAEVERMLIAAIHQEDPDRFIIADGAACCRSPVSGLEDLKGLVGQAARGYSPMSISHCGVAWMGDALKNAKPRWPMYGFSSPLYGSSKSQWRAPLCIAEVPAGDWSVEFGNVSGDNRFTVTADGEAVAVWNLAPATNDAAWVDAEYSSRWKKTTARPARPFTFTLKNPVKELVFDIPAGDWTEVRGVTVAADGRSVTLPSDFVWGKKVNVEPYVFRGWTNEIPFAAKGCPVTGPEWLEQQVFADWIACAERGNFVMIGECGASGGAPYDLYLRWMGDQLKVWRKHNLGFALWTLRGSYGLLDTKRKGVIEVDFHGHRLDKGLLDLIKANATVETPRLSVEADGARVVLETAHGRWRTALAAYPVKVVSATPSALALELETKDGPVRANWRLQDDGTADLVLSAPSARPMSQALDYPPPWETRAGDRGIHPIGEGLAYDVDDPGFYPKKTGYPFRRAHDVTMGFYGLERNGRYLMQGLGEALFAEYFITTNRPRSAFVRWIPENRTWGRDRRIRFFPSPTLGAAAGAYRAWRETFGPIRTLAARAKENSRLELLAGAADFWVWDDNAQNRLYNWPLVKESAPRDVRRLAREMKERGLDRVLWCGFDNETPEDCAFLTDLGYLVGTYDFLRDVYHKGLLQYTDPKNFARGARFLPFAEDVTCIKEDGSFDSAWTIPDKTGKMHDMYGLCDACGPDLARKLIAPDVARIGYSARLMDVQIAEGPHPCWSKTHPATLRQALEAQRTEHLYLQDELKLVVGTEVGSENHIGCFAYSEGAMSRPMVSRPFGWRYKDCAYFGDDVPKGVKTLALNPRTRVPLWELVYHDCSVSYFHWMDTTMIYPEYASWRDLFCVLYGLPPIYSMKVAVWDQLKDQVAASYRRVSPVARRTTFARMTEFRYLTDDRLVQQTEFSNGLRITVNFSDHAFTLPDGRVIGPESSLVTP